MRWEYASIQIVRDDGVVTDAMNSMGANGWEAFAIWDDRIYFKRSLV